MIHARTRCFVFPSPPSTIPPPTHARANERNALHFVPMMLRKMLKAICTVLM